MIVTKKVKIKKRCGVTISSSVMLGTADKTLPKYQKKINMDGAGYGPFCASSF
jgi:hypothetical protein